DQDVPLGTRSPEWPVHVRRRARGGSIAADTRALALARWSRRRPHLPTPILAAYCRGVRAATARGGRGRRMGHGWRNTLPAQPAPRSGCRTRLSHDGQRSGVVRHLRRRLRTRTSLVTAMRHAFIAALALALLAPPARAQWSTTYEQFYLQASHNWVFRDRYVGADRLFNGFDYGHAILYETLWRHPDAPASLLEEREYDHLTKGVLVSPPRLPLQEAAIEVEYAKLAPEAKVMFDWAHILHRQVYDVLADERLSDAQKDAEVARLVAYYRSRPDLAFSAKPKSMKLMQEQPYSLAFRKKYPKFNGLIWAYHWMQVGLYEPLVVNTNSTSRQLGVRATVARFWQMLQDPP